MAKNWTARQQNYIDWLAMPRSLREPRTRKELAERLGICRRTLQRWMKEEGFWEAVFEKARLKMGGDLADVYEALVKQARLGRIHHIKLFLEVMGIFAEKLEIELKGNELDRAIARELARLAGAGEETTLDPAGGDASSPEAEQNLHKDLRK